MILFRGVKRRSIGLVGSPFGILLLNHLEALSFLLLLHLSVLLNSDLVDPALLDEDLDFPLLFSLFSLNLVVG